MAKYTFQAGAHWPNSLIDLTNYKDADNTVGSLIAQIKAYQESGDFDSAQNLIDGNEDILKQYVFDSAAINKYVEELRNLQIYAKARKQQIFYETDESEVSTYVENQDVWLGPITGEGTVITTGTATEAMVMEGATFSSQLGTNLTGTMPVNGAEEITLDPGDSYYIPMGYHDGSGIVVANATSSSGQGKNLDLGTFSVNGYKGPYNVTEASQVTLTVNVPTFQTGTIDAAKGANTKNLEKPITQLLVLKGVGGDSGTAPMTAAWIRNESDQWYKVQKSTNYKIKSIAGNTTVNFIEGNSFEFYWAKAGTVTYYAI